MKKPDITQGRISKAALEAYFSAPTGLEKTSDDGQKNNPFGDGYGVSEGVDIPEGRVKGQANAAEVLSSSKHVPTQARVRLICTQGTSNKFYELEAIGNEVHTRSGKVGTDGKPHVYECDSPASAAKKYADLIRQKTAPTKGYEVDKTQAVEESGSDKITTRAQWDALDASERDDIIEAGGDPERGIDGVFETEIGELTDPKQKAFAQKMADQLSFEIYEEGHATVGPPEIKADVLTLEDGTIVGGRIEAWQHGADHPDQLEDAFDTAEEAEAAGFDTGADVSWRTHGRFNHDMDALREPESMEWMGY